MNANSGTGARVFLTGASGLIGSHVAGALAEAGYEVRALMRDGAKLPPPARRAKVSKAYGDVRDLDSVAAAMEGCEAAVHVAALYSYSRSAAAEMVATNVEGTRNVLDAAVRAHVGRVVLTSTCATCGPVSGRPAGERDEAPSWELVVPYKQTKLAAERIALQRAAQGQDVVIVNPTTTIGAFDTRPTPSGCIVRDVLTRRIRGYIATGGLNVVAAQDVARGHVLALEHGRSGERYLLGGQNMTMRDLFATIARLGGVPAPRIPIPYPLALGAASIVDLLERAVGREPSLLVLDEVRLARLPMYYDCAKAKTELGYEHRPAEQALAEAVAWFAQRIPAAHAPATAPSYGHV